VNQRNSLAYAQVLALSSSAGRGKEEKEERRVNQSGEGGKNVCRGDSADSSAILCSSSDALGGDGRSRENPSSWVINESTVEGYTEKHTGIETG